MSTETGTNQLANAIESAGYATAGIEIAIAIVVAGVAIGLGLAIQSIAVCVSQNPAFNAKGFLYIGLIDALVVLAIGMLFALNPSSAMITELSKEVLSS